MDLVDRINSSHDPSFHLLQEEFSRRTLRDLLMMPKHYFIARVFTGMDGSAVLVTTPGFG